jgi:oligopeptide transport system substrate-binding protein
MSSAAIDATPHAARGIALAASLCYVAPSNTIDDPAVATGCEKGLAMRRGSRVVPLLVVLGLGVLALRVVPATAAQSAEPKILRTIWSGEWIDDLEPQTNESGISDLTLLNYEGLTRIDAELNVVPGAAESWELSPDGLTLTFHLRDHLTYSDGSPLTAERFRYAIARECDPQLDSMDAVGYRDIAGCQAALRHSPEAASASPPPGMATAEARSEDLGVRALDDRTLQITLKQPAPYFPALAAWIGFIPVKQELIAAGGTEWWRDPANWVGNGPFQVSAIEPDADPPVIRRVRNERYWGGKAKLDGIDWVTMPAEQRLAAYERGQLDVMYANPDQLAQFEADPVLSRELLALPTLFADAFLFNLTKAPFTDKHVREAFAYAFDRDTYCHTIDDTCRPVLSWIPQGVPGHIDTDAYSFDPEKARHALAASSYGGPDHLPEITWYYPDDDPWYQKQAEWLRDQFQQVLGVELQLRPVSPDEMDALKQDVNTWPQIWDTDWWSGLADPYEWMQYWTCGNTSFAVKIGYCNPDYDALVAGANRELDPAKRIQLAEESQRLLLADAPAIFAFTFDNLFLVKPFVTGFSLTAPNQSFPGLATPLTVDLTNAP